MSKKEKKLIELMVQANLRFRPQLEEFSKLVTIEQLERV